MQAFIENLREDPPWHEYALTQLARVAPGHSLYDVGAGDGSFLRLARARGWTISGNEISLPMVTAAAARNIELLFGSLEAEQRSEFVDAVTLWCVVAHVQDCRTLLRHVHRILRPGGVVFIRTPTWCLIDRVGLFILRASRGRWPRIMNHRINYAHVQMFTPHSITRELEADDFVVGDINQVCDYGMTTETYLTAMRVGGQAGRIAARGIDSLVRRGLFVRNAIHAYARRGTH